MGHKYIKALIKFSKEDEFQKDLLNGKLFFRSVKGVRSVNDPFDSYGSTAKTDFASIRVLYAPDSFRPITCFYAVVVDDESDFVYLKFFEEQLEKIKRDFGEHVTVIKDVPRFIEQVKKAKPCIWYGCCDYTDDDIPIIPIFNKRIALSDEKEYRLLVDGFVFAHDVDGKNLTEDFGGGLHTNYYKDFYVLDRMLFVDIGNISEISETCTLKQLAEGIKFPVMFDKEKNTPENLTNLKEYKKKYLV